MNDGRKTKAELISELETLRRRLYACEARAARAHIETPQDPQAEWMRWVSDAIILTNTNLQITSWNSAAVNIYGWSVDEAMGQNIDALLKTEFIDTSQAEAQTTLIATGVWRGQVSQQTRSGKRLDVEAAVTFLRDAENNIIGGITINRDITARKQMEEALRTSEDLFKYVFDYSIIGKSITLTSGEMHVNQSFCDMLGYSSEEFKTRTWQDMTHPADIDLTQQQIDALLSGAKETARFIKRFIHKDGSVVWGDICFSLRRDRDGQLLYLVTSVLDITERQQAEVAVQKSHEQLLKFASQVPGMLYQFERMPDGSYRVPFTTETIREIFGCSPEDVREDFSPVAKVIHPEDLARVNIAIEDSFRNMTPFLCEYRVLLPKQPVHWVLAHSIPEKLPSGSVIWSGFNTDITEHKMMEQALEKMASTDPLTGLNNRRHFFRLAGILWQQSIRYRHPLALLMLDLDNLKQINDTYGHALGDEALDLVAAGIRQVLRAADVSARFGGDEFVVLMPETTVTQAIEIADRLQQYLAEHPIGARENALQLTLSIGVTGFVSDRETPNIDALLEHADRALYAAKQAGRNRVQVYQAREAGA